jgi:hypothetical protein
MLFQYEFSQGLMFGIQSTPNYAAAHIGTAASKKYLKKFIHMVGTFTDNEIKLYIDNQLVASADFAYQIPGSSTFRIGNEIGRSYYSNMDLLIWYVGIHLNNCLNCNLWALWQSWRIIINYDLIIATVKC